MNSHTLLSPPSDSTTVLTQARTNNIVFQNTTNTPVPEVYTVCIDKIWPFFVSKLNFDQSQHHWSTVNSQQVNLLQLIELWTVDCWLFMLTLVKIWFADKKKSDFILPPIVFTGQRVYYLNIWSKFFPLTDFVFFIISQTNKSVEKGRTQGDINQKLSRKWLQWKYYLPCIHRQKPLSLILMTKKQTQYNHSLNSIKV